MRVAKDNPDARAAGADLAKSAAVISRLVKNALLPIAALNFGLQKAEAYFRERFGEELAEKTSGIPAENLIAPKTSVAGPVLQGMAFTLDEDELREMYLALMATAMDDRTASLAHPAFAEIIRQLSAEEVAVLNLVMSQGIDRPIAQLQYRANDGSGTMLAANHVLPVVDGDGRPWDDETLSSHFGNWIRLGLVEVIYSTYLVRPNAYDWVQKHHFYEEAARKVPDGYSMGSIPGILRTTDFGDSFAEAVGIAASSSSTVRLGDE